MKFKLWLRNKTVKGLKKLETMLPIKTATFSAGQDSSIVIDCGGSFVVGIRFPAAMTGVSICFLVSLNGTDYYDLYDADGNLYIARIITGGIVSGFQAPMIVGSYFKVQTLDASNNPVAQAADCSIDLIFRGH